MFTQHRQDRLQTPPPGLIRDEVVAQNARWLARLNPAKSARRQLINQGFYQSRHTNKAPIAAPIDQIHMGVHPYQRLGCPRLLSGEASGTESRERLVAQIVERRDQISADLGLDATLSRACQHPGNLWSLHGLNECLTRRSEKVESVLVKQQLDQALSRAEVKIHASCYCRQKQAA